VDGRRRREAAKPDPEDAAAVASAVASRKNWAATCRARAPSARRRPISARRSSTEITIVFAMPTPPTTSATAPRARKSPTNVVRAAIRARRISDGRRTSTASGCAGDAVNGSTAATAAT
jgi:hypothetical protein